MTDSADIELEGRGGLEHRYDFVLLFDIENGNPNGDPDAGNQPRMEPETGIGLVTDVCLKRKVRDYVAQRAPAALDDRHFDIYVKHRGILANEQRKAFTALKLPASKTPNELARHWMCRHFYDVRTFGAVMTMGKAPVAKEDEVAADATVKKGRRGAVQQDFYNCGQVRGAVQLTFARSVDPIVPMELAITRVALTNAGDTDRASTDAETGEEVAGSGQMGRKSFVPYALYRAHGFVNPYLARDTGFSEGDLELFWAALRGMFELDRSATRGMMTTRRLVVFKHRDPLGNFSAARLFERVTVARREPGKPSRSYDDYDVRILQEPALDGIEVLEKA